VERLDDDKLQRYFDGELPEEDAAEVKAALEGSDDDRARLATLERLHELVTVYAKHQHPGVASDEIFEGISSGIATEIAEGRHETLSPVVSIGPTTPPVSIADQRNEPVERWKVWVPALVGAAAAAAVVVFALGGESASRSDEGATTASVHEPTVLIEDLGEEDPGVTIVEAPQGTSVEEVDFGDNVGTVFEVEGDAGEPIAVVWIMDDEMEQATQ